MKISLNWIKEYTQIDQSTQDLVQKIGKQLGAVEEITDIEAKYKGAVIAKVVDCQKHPNADRLNICLLDDEGITRNVERNQDGLVQVVCGAPNMRVGLTVVWLPPGSVVPSTYGTEPFKLDARELRGVKSNGMVASGKELAINDDHQGILELDLNEEKIGKNFAEVYGLNDIVIDIENKMFTHRPDCFGILGVAREIAGICGQEFNSPDWYAQPAEVQSGEGLYLTVENEISELVTRFIAVAIKDVQVKPSPLKLQCLLASVGIKPINNIVDITNYMAHLTGQPLHAYDYDKVANLSKNNASLVVRKPRAGERIALLNGKTIEPHPEAIMIATDKELIGIGGVMGGSTTEVDDNTKNIILECANFDMYSIRKTSMIHGLFTDAVTRNTKGQSPLQNAVVTNQSLKLINDVSGGVQASEVIDLFVGDFTRTEVSVTAEFINKRLGLVLTDDEIIKLLTNVEFGYDKNQDSVTFYPPFWRTDISIPEDIVEEVGRLNGFENMPQELPVRPAKPASINRELAIKQKIRTSLANFGANEILTYSFVHGGLMKKAGQDPSFAFKLSNAISPDLQYYRLSLAPSILNNIHSNIKSGHNSFALFEINKTHINIHANDDNGLPKEIGMVSLVVADKTRKDPAFYKARAYLDELAKNFGVSLSYTPIKESIDYQVTAPYDSARSALVSVEGTDIFLGIIGEYKQSVSKAFKLPDFCAGFDIDLEGIMSIQSGKKYIPLSRYPSTRQDICLEVNDDVLYSELTSKVDQSLNSKLPIDQSVQYVPIDIYKPNESNKKRITYRITLTSYERTLTDEALDKLLDIVVQDTGATRI